MKRWPLAFAASMTYAPEAYPASTTIDRWYDMPKVNGHRAPLSTVHLFWSFIEIAWEVFCCQWPLVVMAALFGRE